MALFVKQNKYYTLLVRVYYIYYICIIFIYDNLFGVFEIVLFLQLNYTTKIFY